MEEWLKENKPDYYEKTYLKNPQEDDENNNANKDSSKKNTWNWLSI